MNLTLLVPTGNITLLT